MPLWLALLLKRQRRADVVPPPWLSRENLDDILKSETSEKMYDDFSASAPLPLPSAEQQQQQTTPPFTKTSSASAAAAAATSNGGGNFSPLPYHWLELGQMLLADAADDVPEAEAVRRLLRDLREVRMSKLRAKVDALHGGGGVRLNGLGALEIGESRAFLAGVVDNMRVLGASREQADRERMEEDDERAGALGRDDDEDEDML